ncbi:acyltransferase family protein [Evansella halocellulosilytica]|uniref:acyltransferase family protein n=1 Tax=Evansella halocellulosilytica TaxID=2011013 RepID=UPI000BB92482|nr:acyltransferase family protein [Evansella halocellulosilytica]
MEKKIIHEAYWLRAISCIAVVITHAVNTTLANYEQTIPQIDEYALILVRFMAFFGTPAFVFISELLLAHSYPNGVPKGFFMKRIKFLLIPFAFMALVFAVVESNSQTELFQNTFLNLFLGGYTGYFILIIFQFYLLHVFLHKQLSKWSPKIILSLTFIINIGYLAFFNFTEPANSPYAAYIWERGYWLLFVGWLFYFALGYYCGKNYQLLKEKLVEYKMLVPVIPIGAMLLLIFLVRSDILDIVSSKRVDMVIYTTGMIFTIILLTSVFKQVPKLILFISKFSFNIYLIHKIFLYYLQPIDFLPPLAYFVFATVYAIIGAILVSKILSIIPFSPFLIGKTIPVPKVTKDRGAYIKSPSPK